MKKIILSLTLLSLPMSGYAFFWNKESDKFDALHRRYIEKKLFIEPTQEGKSLPGAILKWGVTGALCVAAAYTTRNGYKEVIKDTTYDENKLKIIKETGALVAMCFGVAGLSYFLLDKYVHKKLCFENKCVETFKNFIEKWPEHIDSTPVIMREYLQKIHDDFVKHENPDEYIEAIAIGALEEVKLLLSQ